MIRQAFQPSKSWGPSNAEDRKKWLAFRNDHKITGKKKQMSM